MFKLRKILKPRWKFDVVVEGEVLLLMNAVWNDATVVLFSGGTNVVRKVES